MAIGQAWFVIGGCFPHMHTCSPPQVLQALRQGEGAGPLCLLACMCVSKVRGFSLTRSVFICFFQDPRSEVVCLLL